jgi:hypothetical protein
MGKFGRLFFGNVNVGQREWILTDDLSRWSAEMGTPQRF